MKGCKTLTPTLSQGERGLKPEGLNVYNFLLPDQMVYLCDAESLNSRRKVSTTVLNTWMRA